MNGNLELAAPGAWDAPLAAEGILAGYSLEMTAKDVDALVAARDAIPAETAVFITFLPGDAPETRLAAARSVREAGFVPVPHLSARRIRSEAELETFLTRLARETGTDRAFVVAGDLPSALGPYPDALAVLRSGLLETCGIRRVGIAGYPEGHPQIAQGALWAALRDKIAAIRGAGQSAEIVTQFGFDADPVLAWLAALRAEGIAEPVRIGLPGPASARRLLQFAARCGVGASTAVLAKYGISITRLLSSAGPDRLLSELEARLDPGVHGEVHIHLYPFGGLAAAANWARAAR